jgi:hypothetical protein
MIMDILTIANAHAAACGLPPVIEKLPGQYIGYFENRHGEQWIFVGDPVTSTAKLYGGDCDWTCFDLTNQKMSEPMMDEREQGWLISCWASLLDRPLAVIQKEFMKQYIDRMIDAFSKTGEVLTEDQKTEVYRKLGI